jgi:hypothetical protein
MDRDRNENTTYTTHTTHTPEFILPDMHQLFEHGEGTRSLNLSKATIMTEILLYMYVGGEREGELFENS